jgi:EAL domain-containing protein (putative c-di-GMP-specific phosphodiesterase class I)/GGDEF domain-containing protein
MNIRDACCWIEIERLFNTESTPYSENGVEKQSSKFCDYPIFLDRFRQALHRARRENKHVLLVLLKLVDNRRNSPCGKVGGRTVDLTVCRVGSCLRSNDTVCDLGAGRVAILIEDLGESSHAPLIIEKIHSMLIDPLKVDSGTTHIQPFSGATLFPEDAEDSKQLWCYAELALEQAMQSMPGTFCFSPMATGHAVMERFELTKDLYRAFRNQEFHHVYQPVIDLDGNQVKAVEVFLRWQHPERGFLYPFAFLRLLEESGLIVPVGEQVLKEACQFLKGLLEEGYLPVRLCINISGRQMADSGFLLAVLDALYEADLDPSLLQLECSEEVLAHYSEVAQRILPELKNAGVKVAVDQFGVGESSLAELIRLPITLIKIDRSLIERLMEDSISQAITSGAFAVARSTGMDVAAVGVEQASQMGILEKMGCKEVQGNYFSRPLPAHEMSVLLPA